MNEYTVIVKSDLKKSSNLFDVLDIIKKFESDGKEVIVFCSYPTDSDKFKQRVRNIYR